MKSQELYEDMVGKLDLFRKNAESFVTKGNKSAGVRSRKLSLELEKAFKQWRKSTIAEVKGSTE